MSRRRASQKRLATAYVYAISTHTYRTQQTHIPCRGYRSGSYKSRPTAKHRLWEMDPIRTYPAWKRERPPVREATYKVQVYSYGQRNTRERGHNRAAELRPESWERFGFRTKCVFGIFSGSFPSPVAEVPGSLSRSGATNRFR